MTRFEPSDRAKLTAQLDNHSDRKIEYWSKKNEKLQNYQKN